MVKSHIAATGCTPSLWLHVEQDISLVPHEAIWVAVGLRNGASLGQAPLPSAVEQSRPPTPQDSANEGDDEVEIKFHKHKIIWMGHSLDSGEKPVCEQDSSDSKFEGFPDRVEVGVSGGLKGWV